MSTPQTNPDTLTNPGRAREALECIADLTGPAASDHWAVVALQEVLRQFEKARQGKEAHDEQTCPGCRVTRFTTPFATDHLANCSGHPAVRRARAVRDAIRLAPEVLRSLGLDVATLDPASLDEHALVPTPAPRWKSRWTYVLDDSSLRYHLDHLAGPERAKYPTLTADYLSSLEDVIEAWRRIVQCVLEERGRPARAGEEVLRVSGSFRLPALAREAREVPHHHRHVPGRAGRRALNVAAPPRLRAGRVSLVR